MNSSARRTCDGSVSRLPIQQMAEGVPVGAQERHQNGLLEFAKHQRRQPVGCRIELFGKKLEKPPEIAEPAGGLGRRRWRTRACRAAVRPGDTPACVRTRRDRCAMLNQSWPVVGGQVHGSDRAKRCRTGARRAAIVLPPIVASPLPARVVNNRNRSASG